MIDGHVTWILDGYTTTDAYPYAQQANTDGLDGTSGLDTSFNYVRNSVKATVDAYDGTIKLYVVDDTDPMIKAYQAAFPSLFTSDAPSEELRSHFRYPEDIFKVQTNMWGKYHVTDPDTFYNGSDQWLVAKDPGIQEARAATVTTVAGDTTAVVSSNAKRIDPYYQLMQLPGETDTSFLLLRPFVPFSDNDSRQQLKAFMVAKSDPGSYGKLETFVMPGDNPPEGPGLVAGRIQADPQVSAAQTLLCQQGSKCLYGNLLLIPVEQSLIYVRPLYVIAQGNELPLLKKIVVEFQGQVSIADDLSGALRRPPRLPGSPTDSGIVATPQHSDDDAHDQPRRHDLADDDTDDDAVDDRRAPRPGQPGLRRRQRRPPEDPARLHPLRREAGGGAGRHPAGLRPLAGGRPGPDDHHVDDHDNSPIRLAGLPFEKAIGMVVSPPRGGAVW